MFVFSKIKYLQFGLYNLEGEVLEEYS